MSKLAKVMSGQAQKGLKMFKSGGKAHDDEAQDKALIKKMLKDEEKIEGKKCGGKMKMKKGGRA